MDRITHTLLQDFLTEQGLAGLSEDAAFERFCNYCIVSREYSDSFDVEDVSCGSPAAGLDGIVVIANGSLVTTEEEIKDLIDLNGFLEVVFVFTQAKTSASFDGAQIGNFSFAVKDFFAEAPRLVRSEFVNHRVRLQEYIYKHSAKMTKGKPIAKLYYLTTGTWTGDQNLVSRIKSERDDLISTKLFKEVIVEALGADEIQHLYQSTKNRVSGDFVFSEKTVLPDIQGVTEAYLGVLRASDYLKLITDDAGNIHKSLFYDNVRDFQDYNDVNKDVRATLQSEYSDRFAILNNGVTIVAKALTTVGNRFHIEDYQVVNGCQTSHVLFNERSLITSSVHVPVKIIVTSDENVTNDVIKATNRQTPVKVEQLHALSDFQKKLEAFYSTFDAKQRLHYERRSRQYAGAPNVEKVRVVSLANQIRAFASMFLHEPHRAGRYYGTLLRSVGESIFRSDHQLLPYYTSSYALYRLEYLFRNSTISTECKPARYHMIMALRYQLAGADHPSLNSPEIDKYCEKMLRTLWDDHDVVGAFEEALEAIARLTKNVYHRDTFKTQSFTEELRRSLGKK